MGVCIVRGGGGGVHQSLQVRQEVKATSVEQGGY